MNLLLFTIEVERSTGVDGWRNTRPRAAERRRLGRVRWIGLGVLATLSAIAPSCGGWALAGGDPTRLDLPGWVTSLTPAAPSEADGQAQLESTSQPAGATLMLDGHPRGSTPLVLTVSHGVHTLLPRHSDAIDQQRQMSVLSDATINVSMSLRGPTATLLKPAYPGASITDVAFLEDGRLALSMAVPTTSTNTAEHASREAWIFDPVRGSLAQFAAPGSNPRAAEVSISPDGHHLAYLQAQPSASMPSGVSPRWNRGLGCKC